MYEACRHAFDNSTSQPSDHFSGLDYSPGFVYSSPSEHEYLRNSYTLPDPMVCTEHNLPPCCSENTISRFTSHCLVICGVRIPQPVTESYCFSSANMPSFYLQPTEFYSHVIFYLNCFCFAYLYLSRHNLKSILLWPFLIPEMGSDTCWTVIALVVVSTTDVKAFHKGLA